MKHRTPKAPAPPKDFSYALRERVGHLLLTPSGIQAWYAKSPALWDFRSDSQREALIGAEASAVARLSGKWLHQRVLSRPFSSAEWARLNAERIPAGPIDDVFKARSVAVQRHTRARVLTDSATFLGVTVGDRRAVSRLSALRDGKAAAQRDVDALREVIDEVDEIMAMPGLAATPVNDEQIAMLYHRSVGLGLPDPVHIGPAGEGWDGEDLATFTDGVDMDPCGFERVVRLVSHPGRTGGTEPIERWVVVLTVGRMESLIIPGPHRPWMTETERLPFPVEWSSHVEIIGGDKAAKDMAKRLDLIADQRGQYRKHPDLAVPPNLERVHQRAVTLRDEMEEGDVLSSSRAYGYHHVAVAGATKEEAFKRARAVANLYHPRIRIEHQGGQAALLRSFVPGERIQVRGHKRRLSVPEFTAALPSKSSAVGDEHGFYLGFGSRDGRRAVMWDPHHGPRVTQASGLTPIITPQGGGKSVLMGHVADESVIAHIHTTIVDPSGPMLALATGIPEYHQGGRSARGLDMLNGEPGSLSPYTAVAEPKREQFLDDESVRVLEHHVDRRARVDTLWHEAQDAAARMRRLLARDTARMLLPPMEDALPQTRRLLNDAMRAVGGYYESSLNEAIEWLDQCDDEHGKVIADALRDMREMPRANLFFPSGADVERSTRADDDDVTLLVMAMPGLVLPDPNTERTHWTDEEQISLPLLNLGVHKATRRIYSQPKNEPKMFMIDEAHFLQRWPSGRALLTRTTRDTRKWTLRVLAASQDPWTALGGEDSIGSLVEEVFIGRMEDPRAASRALEMARIPTGVGYEKTLASLSPRDPQGNTLFHEFLFRDVTGRAQVIRPDLAHKPHVLDALRTRKVASVPSTRGTYDDLDEVLA